MNQRPLAPVFLLCVGGSLLAAWTVGHASSDSPPNPGLALSQLCAASAVRMEAMVEARTVQPAMAGGAATDGLAIDGWFAFASDGAAWRMSSGLDPERYGFGSVEASYDGVSDYALVMHESGMSYVSHDGEPDEPPPTLPNLLLELGSWTRPLNRLDSPTPPMLSQLQAIPPESLALVTGTWEAVVEDGQPRLQAFVPATSELGEPYVNRLVVAPDAPDELRAIERLTPDGQVLTRVEFDAWTTVDGWSGGPRLPRLIEAYEYDPSGLPVATIAFTILSLELEPPAAILELEADTDATPHLLDADTLELLR